MIYTQPRLGGQRNAAFHHTDNNTDQRPIAIPIQRFPPFQVHPPTPINQITEYINESLFNDLFVPNHRFRIPAECRQGLLLLLELLMNLNLLCGPRGDSVDKGSAELQGRRERGIHPRKSSRLEVVPVERFALALASLLVRQAIMSAD